MARDFSLLPGDMRKVSRLPRKRANEIVRAGARAFGIAAVDGTPVDTGLARSNWRATVNNPASGGISPYSPGMRLGIGERANAIAAQAQQHLVIKDFDVKKHKALFITNRVRYITYINDGKPNRAPHNMFEKGKMAADKAITAASKKKFVRRSDNI